MKKFFYLTLLFISFSFLSIGQTAEQLMSEYDDLVKKNQNELALKKKQEIFSWVEKNIIVGDSFYFDKKDYKSAEPYFVKSLLITKNVLGENHSDYEYILNKLILIYKKDRNFKLLEALYLEKLVIIERKQGKLNSGYADYLMMLAFLYEDMHNLKLAEQYYKDELEIRKLLLGKYSNVYLKKNGHLAVFYLVNKNYKSAEIYFKENIEILNAINSENSSDYAENLNNLGILYSLMDDYKSALVYFKKALSINEKLLENNNPIYIKNLTSIANSFRSLWEFNSAKYYYKQVIEIKQKAGDINNQDYANNLIDLGFVYINIGDYKSADSCYKESQEITKKIAGIYDKHYIDGLSHLGLLYSKIGDNKSALIYSKESLELTKESFGEMSLEYADNLFLVGNTYIKMNEYKTAEIHLKKCLEIKTKILGDNHPDNVPVLSGLGLLYSDIADYKTAQFYYKKVLQLQKNTVGEDNLEYSTTLMDYAVFCSKIGDFKSAESLFIEALEIIKKVSGESNPYYSQILNNLGRLYSDVGNNKKSEKYYKMAIEIRKSFLGDNHPDYISSLNDLGLLYFKIDNYIESEKIFNEVFTLKTKDLITNFEWRSEIEREIYWQKESDYFNMITESYSYFYSIIPSSSELVYNSALVSKALMLEANRNFLDFLKTNKDSTLTASFNNLRGLRTYYSKLYSEGSNEFELMKKINHEADSLDLILSRKTSSYAASKKRIQTNWLDVQANLNLDEIAIEFEKYFDGKDSTYHYMALLIKAGDKYPQLTRLCSETELSSFSTETELKELYNLIWKPLLPALNNIKTIYYSPVGLLNNIPFHALFNIKDEKRNYVIDYYTLHQLTSTRYLALGLKQKTNEITEPNIALFGGINYNDIPTSKSDSVNELGMETAFLYKHINREINDSSRSGGSYLPGSKKEVDNIAELLKSKQWDVSLVEDKNASEGKVKYFSGTNSKSILHIATHGFAFPDKVENIKNSKYSLINGSKNYTASDNPMIRCGLLFGGANITWQGQNDSVLNATNDDGILTAYELSQLDLSNTKLAVLSACETGKGSIQGSEGTFGLKRALKLAGVDNMIVSLWSVPDDATMQMMTLFYTELAKTKNPVTSFEFAQKTMRNNHPDEPKKWAGFVFVR